MVVTPDLDVYAENYAPDNADVQSARLFDGVHLPVGVEAVNVYGFAPRLDAAECARLAEEGRRLAGL
eukprot:10923830-Lingulodinium_polyedra.AAC.1